MYLIYQFPLAALKINDLICHYPLVVVKFEGQVPYGICEPANYLCFVHNPRPAVFGSYHLLSKNAVLFLKKSINCNEALGRSL